MSERDEVLKKADALLGRYGRGARKAEDEFPVLTEVVDEPPTADAAARPVGSPDKVHEGRRQLEERILREVERAVSEQLGDVLGEPLRERLQASLQRALDAAAEQIRNDMESMVHAAVEQAIKRLRDELL